MLIRKSTRVPGFYRIGAGEGPDPESVLKAFDRAHGDPQRLPGRRRQVLGRDLLVQRYAGASLLDLVHQQDAEELVVGGGYGGAEVFAQYLTANECLDAIGRIAHIDTGLERENARVVGDDAHAVSLDVDDLHAVRAIGGHELIEPIERCASLGVVLGHELQQTGIPVQLPVDVRAQLARQFAVSELRIEVEHDVRPSRDLLVRAFGHLGYLRLP
jgi:hypothetical protein